MGNAHSSEKKFYGVKDIQRIFGVGRNKAIALLNTEGFPTIKIGRTYRVETSELENWIKENKGKNIAIGKDGDNDKN